MDAVSFFPKAFAGVASGKVFYKPNFKPREKYSGSKEKTVVFITLWLPGWCRTFHAAADISDDFPVAPCYNNRKVVFTAEETESSWLRVLKRERGSYR